MEEMQDVEEHDPSFILGQLVAVAQCLHDVVETLDIKVEDTEYYLDENHDMEIHCLALRLLERELAHYEKALLSLGKIALLEDMKHIFYLKVKYDFEDEELDSLAYQRGYQFQIEKHQCV